MTSTPELQRLTGPRARLLAIGVVTLEFAAAVTAFVTATLLPVVVAELSARDRLGPLVAAEALGGFLALCLATPVVARLGRGPALWVGVAGYLTGALIAATATGPWWFGAGALTSGLSGGLLAVFGVSAVVEHLDGALRARVIAVSSAMWVIPALVGPPATLALESLVGWRLTLLAPVPLVLLGRIIVARAGASSTHAPTERRWQLRTFLVPLGALLLIAATGHRAVDALGVALALIGVAALMPAGTFRAKAGAPASLASLTLFAIGWFGATALITLFATEELQTDLPTAALFATAGPLSWALVSLAVAHWKRVADSLVVAPAGLVIAGFGTIGTALSPTVGLALGMWSAAGVGIGLAYPRLYVGATTLSDTSTQLSDPTTIAKAVIAAEAFGGLVGPAAAAALAADAGLRATIVTAGVVLLAATGAASRLRQP